MLSPPSTGYGLGHSLCLPGCALWAGLPWVGVRVRACAPPPPPPLPLVYYAASKLFPEAQDFRSQLTTLRGIGGLEEKVPAVPHPCPQPPSRGWCPGY